MLEVQEILSDLIQSKSVTPFDDGAIEKVRYFLSDLGFECHVLEFAGTERPIQNIYARYGQNGENICFSGHTDVVPSGDDSSWTVDPFSGTIQDGVVCGRGAVDMKGGIACFLVAIREFLQENPNPNFSISVLISGNEEGDVTGGMPELMDWLKEKNEKIDFCMMAEPSSIKTIGDAYKIGRRGSVNFILEAEGVQGHIAEQESPDNVVSKLAGVISELSSMKLDNGSEYFQPSNLEFSTFDVANPTENIIPQKAEARFNIRFNKEHTGESLVALIQDATEQLANKYEITSYKLNYRISGEPFISQKDDKHQFLAESIKAVAGIETKSDTNGGTSDLRLMQDGIGGCAEFGLLNDTMHQVDERTSIADLESVKNIFYKWLLKLNS